LQVLGKFGNKNMTAMVNPRLEEIVSMPAALPKERSAGVSLEGDNGETSRAIKSLLDSNPYCDLEHI
jgi:hypothetical protein